MVDSVKRRNIAVINETLRKIVGYRYREALVVDVEKLWVFRKELKDLAGKAVAKRQNYVRYLDSI